VEKFLLCPQVIHKKNQNFGGVFGNKNDAKKSYSHGYPQVIHKKSGLSTNFFIFCG
jgi:hypothetical protein